MRDLAAPCPTDLTSPDARLLALASRLSAGWVAHMALPDDVADDRWNASYEACAAIADEMLPIRPHTLEGFAAKAMIVGWCHGDGQIDFVDTCCATKDVRAAQSIVIDLINLSGLPRPACSMEGQADA